MHSWAACALRILQVPRFCWPNPHTAWQINGRPLGTKKRRVSKAPGLFVNIGDVNFFPLFRLEMQAFRFENPEAECWQCQPGTFRYGLGVWSV